MEMNSIQLGNIIVQLYEDHTPKTRMWHNQNINRNWEIAAGALAKTMRITSLILIFKNKTNSEETAEKQKLTSSEGPLATCGTCHVGVFVLLSAAILHFNRAFIRILGHLLNNNGTVLRHFLPLLPGRRCEHSTLRTAGIWCLMTL